MQKLKDAFFLVIGIAVVVWSFYMFLQKPAPAHYQRVTDDQQQTTHNGTLKVGDRSIFVEIADTDAKRTQGLSLRQSLAPNTGLFFIFENPGNYGFWMKDMRFPIDIIFLDADLSVINVYRGVDPSTFPTLFYPLAPAKYVLEINSGEASSIGIDTGVNVSLDR